MEKRTKVLLVTAVSLATLVVGVFLYKKYKKPEAVLIADLVFEDDMPPYAVNNEVQGNTLFEEPEQLPSSPSSSPEVELVPEMSEGEFLVIHVEYERLQKRVAEHYRFVDQIKASMSDDKFRNEVELSYSGLVSALRLTKNLYRNLRAQRTLALCNDLEISISQMLELISDSEKIIKYLHKRSEEKATVDAVEAVAMELKRRAEEKIKVELALDDLEHANEPVTATKSSDDKGEELELKDERVANLQKAGEKFKAGLSTTTQTELDEIIEKEGEGEGEGTTTNSEAIKEGEEEVDTETSKDYEKTDTEIIQEEIAKQEPGVRGTQPQWQVDPFPNVPEFPGGQAWKFGVPKDWEKKAGDPNKIFTVWEKEFASKVYGWYGAEKVVSMQRIMKQMKMLRDDVPDNLDYPPYSDVKFDAVRDRVVAKLYWIVNWNDFSNAYPQEFKEYTDSQMVFADNGDKGDDGL